VRTLSSVLELSQTFNVQTYRQKDEGDTIFVEFIGVEGSLRLAPPPVVSDVIARQRDAITGKSRSKAAKANALDRKARGIEPGFKNGRESERDSALTSAVVHEFECLLPRSTGEKARPGTLKSS